MRNFWALSLGLIFLAGCSANMGHREPKEVKGALNEVANQQNRQPLENLPVDVTNDLMPSFGEQQFVPVAAKENRFRVNAKDVGAQAFFGSLIKGTPYNLVIHPDVSGKISLSLKDVTLDEVLSVASDIYGYEITRNGNVIQVFPATLRTETIPVDYLQLQRKGSSLTTISTGSISSGSDDSGSDSDDSGDSSSGSGGGNTTTGGASIQTSSESNFWGQLEKALAAMIGSGQGRSVVVSPQASLVTVRAYPNELREVRTFLGVSQKRLRRQVIMEAKILEVTLSDSYQQGIEWSNITKSLGGTVLSLARPGASIPTDSVGAQLGGQTSLTISDGNFNAVLNFLETQGDVNVLSSPRVTAANNQKAIIKVGGDEYYVTNVSSSDASGDNAQSTPEIELTPFFSGISLDVTPQIDNEGGVLLHVHPTVVDVTNETKEINLGSKFGTFQLPLAKSTIRESDSIVHAKSGDVVVIGGLMKSAVTDQVSKVPLLGDVPGLGHLFRNVYKLHTKTELVILLKPTVVSDQTWLEEIERSRRLITEWFPEE